MSNNIHSIVDFIYFKYQPIQTGPGGVMVERSLGVRKVEGFDPQPRHTKSCKKMVQVAPLLTLGIERRVLGNVAGRPGVSL